MNALRNTRNQPPTSLRTAKTAPTRNVNRERDFGIGYGNSSGYASTERRYAAAGTQPGYFRCR